MKFYIATLLCFICLQSHAVIIQQQVVVDAPVVSVLAGPQDNGNVAIEQLFTDTTTSAQDSLTRSDVPFSSSQFFGGSEQPSVPAAFAELTDVSVEPPTNILPPTVVPAIPEPETYALMAIGLSGLLLARRKRAKNSQL